MFPLMQSGGPMRDTALPDLTITKVSVLRTPLDSLPPECQNLSPSAGGALPYLTFHNTPYFRTLALR